MPVLLGRGKAAVPPMRVAYSTAFPHIELHEARPGTALAERRDPGQLSPGTNGPAVKPPSTTNSPPVQ